VLELRARLNRRGSSPRRITADYETLHPRGDSSSNEDEDEASQAAATTSGASESASTSDDCCEVCLMASPAGFALVPCRHARFCQSCAMRMSDVAAGCRFPIVAFRLATFHPD